VERLAAVGLGEYHPLVDEATQEAYAMNRRLELRFR
jgi:outer membrane protein OmpA-like peptidoglycan-associated protein